MTVKTDDFKSGKRDDDPHRRLDAVRFRGEWVTYTSRYECLYL